MKWLAAGVTVAGMALAVAVFGLARERTVDPAADTSRLPAVAQALPTKAVTRPLLKPNPQEPRPQPATACRKDDDLDRTGEDEADAPPTRAGCGTEDLHQKENENENESAGDEADENEDRDDQASDQEPGDAKDDQAGDSDGSGD